MTLRYEEGIDREERLRAERGELLEALESLWSISPVAKNSREGEIHLRVMAVIRKAKGEL